MITFPSFLRKLSCIFALVLLSLVCGATAAYATSGSVSVTSDPSSGILNFTFSSAIVTCGQTDTRRPAKGTLRTYTNFSYVANGVTYPLSGTATYLGVCGGNEDWDGPQISTAVMTDPINSSCTITYSPGGSGAVLTCSGVQGYINPKYVVVGVTYAPPGHSSYVTYTNSKGIATTTSLSNTFSDSTTYSVSLTATAGIPGYKSSTTAGYSNTGSQSTKDSKSVTLNWAISDSFQTFGTPNDFSPVDSDYDVVYVWLNPVEVFTVLGNNVTWNGYGYDANDQNGLDIVGIPLGYLNGHWTMPADLLASTNRTWASTQMFAAGQSAALNSTDFANIAAADPFSSNVYGPNDIGFVPPSPSTPDNRFTLTTCNSGNSVSYDQPAPSQTPGPYTCTLQYSNLTTNAQAQIVGSSTTFSLDRSFTIGGYDAGFGGDLTLDLKYAYTTTSQTEVDSSISTTQSSSSVASITGPACGNAVLGVGPCVPEYDAAGNEPIQFNIYQDNLYGTFMFAPVHYF